MKDDNIEQYELILAELQQKRETRKSIKANYVPFKQATDDTIIIAVTTVLSVLFGFPLLMLLIIALMDPIGWSETKVLIQNLGILFLLSISTAVGLKLANKKEASSHIKPQFEEINNQIREIEFRLKTVYDEIKRSGNLKQIEPKISKPKSFGPSISKLKAKKKTNRKRELQNTVGMPTQTPSFAKPESVNYIDLNETLAKIQHHKRAKNYSIAMPLALELVANHPTEPLAYKSLAKVQALAGETNSAKESMAMVLNLFQTDLTTAFVDVQYEQRITPLFHHLFLEYINAAYYIAEFQKHINSSLPESIKTALLGEALPDITNEATMKRQILSGISQCDPFWNRTENEFKHAIENLIDSISLK